MRVGHLVIKKKNLSLIVLSFLLIIIFIIIVSIINSKKDYSISYKIDNFDINESYNKNYDTYFLNINIDNREYSTYLIKDNINNKKIINKLEEFILDNESCIKISSKYTSISPVCIKDNELVSLNLTSMDMQNKFNNIDRSLDNTEESTLSDYKVSNYMYNTYYVWNYLGFDVLKDNNISSDNFLNKEVYNPNLITEVNNIILVPDYNDNYYFNKFYLINMKNGNRSEWKINESIYFDSSILGIYHDEVYLIDKHENREWIINPIKKTIKEAYGVTIVNGSTKNITMSKLVNGNYSFDSSLVKYEVINNYLYATFNDKKIKLAMDNPKYITSDDNAIYYLIKDSLYALSKKFGVVKLISKFEWNFNSDNIIFILK